MNSPDQENLRSFSTKQTHPPSMLNQNNYNEWSSPETTEQNCVSSFKVCLLGLLLGALFGCVALGTILALWLKTTSTNNTISNLSVRTIVSSTVAAANTIPVTAAPTTICSVSAVSTTTVSPNTTTIFTVINPCSAVSTYLPVVYYYIASGSSETITFGIQNNPAATYIDDVSVISNGVELLCNGGFENGTQICWQGANHISSGCGHTGSYCYSDAIVGSVDYVSQTFSTTPGALLNISFWTYWTGSGAGIITTVTISP